MRRYDEQSRQFPAWTYRSTYDRMLLNEYEYADSALQLNSNYLKERLQPTNLCFRFQLAPVKRRRDYMDEALRRQPLIAINFILSPIHLECHQKNIKPPSPHKPPSA